jgi:hypothetical protein
MRDPLALELVRNAVSEHPRGIAGVADEIDYSRTALSLYLGDSYSTPAKIDVAILARYNRRICPHTREEVAPDYCHKKALAPKPYGGAARERHWEACQACPNKPAKE